MKFIKDKIIKIIEKIIMTIPGIASFAKVKIIDTKDLSTDDIKEAIEIIKNFDNSGFVIKIHIILIDGIDLVHILKQTQKLIKYELDKEVGFKLKFKIDILVEGVLQDTNF